MHIDRQIDCISLIYAIFVTFDHERTNDTAALQKLDTTLRITGVILHQPKEVPWGTQGLEVHPNDTEAV